MKKCYYIFSLVLFMGISLLVLETDIYSAPRKASTKRAATGGKASTKRAATGGKASTKRAATGGKASTKRAATGGKASTKRAMARGKKSSTPAATPAVTQVVEEVVVNDTCPVGKILQRTVNEEGVETYNVSKKETCTLPENGVATIQWKKSNIKDYPLSLQVRPTWIAESNAYYLQCTDGFVETTINKVKTCVDYTTICPLSTNIVKSGDGFVHPNTGDVCLAPEYTFVTHPETSWDLPPEDLYIFACEANYYPVVSSMNASISVQCKNCPSGTYSPRGAKDENDCNPPCPKNETYVRLKEGDTEINECRACDNVGTTYNTTTKTCEPKMGYDCINNGTYCTETITASICDENASFTDGKCVCNSGYEGDGAQVGTYLGADKARSKGCLRICDTNATRQSDNSCACNDRYIGDGLTCTACHANATKQSDNTCKCNSGYEGDGISCTLISTSVTAPDCVSEATFSNGSCICPAGTFGDGLKENDQAPFCKHFPDSAICKTSYDSSSKKGTEKPRGCVPKCSTGSYWAAD